MVRYGKMMFFDAPMTPTCRTKDGKKQNLLEQYREDVPPAEIVGKKLEAAVKASWVQIGP